MADLYLLFSILPAVILLPVFYWSKNSNNINFVNVSIGGLASWSAVALILYLPSLLLYETSTLANYVNAMVNLRTPLFWLLVLFTLINESIRYLFMRLLNFLEKSYSRALIFGVSWSVLEILTRFISFIPDPFTVIEGLIFFILFSLVNVNLTIILLRAAENTKFVIFNVFTKLIVELSLFGMFGHGIDTSEILDSFSIIIFLQFGLVVLSILAVKYKIED